MTPHLAGDPQAPGGGLLPHPQHRRFPARKPRGLRPRGARRAGRGAPRDRPLGARAPGAGRAPGARGVPRIAVPRRLPHAAEFSARSTSRPSTSTCSRTALRARRDDPARRASQTVLHNVLESLVLLMSPVLSFTAEEIWQAMPPRAGRARASFSCRSHRRLRPQARTNCSRAGAAARGAPAREQGARGRQGDDRQVARGRGHDRRRRRDPGLSRGLRRQLAEVFIVSALSWARTRGEGAVVSVRRAPGSKCRAAGAGRPGSARWRPTRRLPRCAGALAAAGRGGARLTGPARPRKCEDGVQALPHEAHAGVVFLDSLRACAGVHGARRYPAGTPFTPTSRRVRSPSWT